MTIISISNNYGSNYDGIGKYAKYVYGALDKDLYRVVSFTSYCETNSGIKKIFSMGMSYAIFKAIRFMCKHKTDIVIIEYPFVEWNPFFCVIYMLMCAITLIKNVKVFISVHEYSRSRSFRKLVTIYLCFLASGVVASEDININLLRKFNNNVKRIIIPANFYSSYDTNKLKKRQYVYFGLINGTKAFQEMLEAWNRFNKLNKYKLYILSSTDISVDCSNGVIFKKNLSDTEISYFMAESLFAVLPIKPQIDEKNSTFKAACLSGCISLGVFCEKYKNLEFVLNGENNSVDKWYELFCHSEKLCNMADCQKLCAQSYEYSKQYSIDFSAANLDKCLRG